MVEKSLLGHGISMMWGFLQTSGLGLFIIIFWLGMRERILGTICTVFLWEEKYVKWSSIIISNITTRIILHVKKRVHFSKKEARIKSTLVWFFIVMNFAWRRWTRKERIINYLEFFLVSSIVRTLSRKNIFHEKTYSVSLSLKLQFSILANDLTYFLIFDMGTMRVLSWKRKIARIICASQLAR